MGDSRTSAIAQPKGHTPLLIFRNLSVSALDSRNTLTVCRFSNAGQCLEKNQASVTSVARR